MQQHLFIRIFIISLFLFMVVITYSAANYGWWLVSFRNPVIMQQYQNEYDYNTSSGGYRSIRGSGGSSSSKSKSFRSGSSKRSFTSGSRSGGGK